jgi:ABC-type Mn2+/Zn2+ transport system permease subunit
MAKGWRYSRNEVLVVAACLSGMLSVIGLALFAFSSELPSQGLLYKLTWIAPISTFPLFALVFFTRRLLRWGLWVLAMAGYCGEVAVLSDTSSRGDSVLGTSLVGAAVSAFLYVPVVLSIFVAALVEYSYRLERREILDAPESPNQLEG